MGTAERDGQLLANRYQLEVEIDRGAIGTVWRARDVSTGEPVAVKVLLPETEQDADVVKSLLDEAEVLSQLNHPSIVRPRDFVANGVRALVMDLVEGVDVRKRILHSGPLRPTEAAEVAAQIADALASVHGAGMLHGDVKPGNIMMPSNGGPAKLVDFGVARRITLPDTVTHATPEYVAPEVVSGGKPAAASDVYSMGMVVYEMACGRSPYRGGNVHEVLERHTGCMPVQPAGMPDELWEVVSRCVDVRPDARPTAGELAAELRELAPRLVGRPAAGNLPEHATTWRPRLIDPSQPASAPPANVPPASAPPASAPPASAPPVWAEPISAAPSAAPSRGVPSSAAPFSAPPTGGAHPTTAMPASSPRADDAAAVLSLFDRSGDERTTRLDPVSAPIAAAVSMPAGPPMGEVPESQSSSKAGKGLAIFTVAAALVLLLAVGGVALVWSGGLGSGEPGKEPAAAETESPKPDKAAKPSPSDKPASPDSPKPDESDPDEGAQPPSGGGDNHGGNENGGDSSGGGESGGGDDGRPEIGDPMPTFPGN